MAGPTFAQFRKLAKRFEVQVVDHGNGHWQVRSRLIVNYYPFSKRGATIFVNGQSNAVIHGSMEDAIKAALLPPGVVRIEERLSTGRSRTERRRLWAKDQYCYWCRVRLALTPSASGLPLATLDHFIPLGRGGTNRRENLVLACNPCNHRRGSDMPELQGGLL